MCLKYFIGEDAHLPSESAKIGTEEDCLSISEDLHSSPAKADERKKPARISNDDVLKKQYECLCTQKETLILKKQKLKLQINLLEQQVNANKTFGTALNANFVVADIDSL